MITEEEKSNFLHILSRVNARNVKIFTQQELSTHLGVSRKKIIDFQKGRIFDFWLLCRYADLLGMEIKFKLSTTY